MPCSTPGARSERAPTLVIVEGRRVACRDQSQEPRHIANMGLCDAAADVPVVLVGDIDRGRPSSPSVAGPAI